ncbi:MAG: hypothetical protein K9M11_00625 [Candidatus Pacebacteria bacterium]|nr:hypothetical protein [Candidatus Paceibacterota bacterium]
MHFNTNEIMIPLTSWTAFDRGEIIEANSPDGITLKVGDTIWWVCAQYDGTCSVVEAKSTVPGSTVKIKKLAN